MQNQYIHIPDSELEILLPSGFKFNKTAFVNVEKEVALSLFVIKYDSTLNYKPIDRTDSLIEKGYEILDVQKYDKHGNSHFLYFVSTSYLGNIKTHEILSNFVYKNYYISLNGRIKKESYMDTVENIINSIKSIRIKPNTN